MWPYAIFFATQGVCSYVIITIIWQLQIFNGIKPISLRTYTLWVTTTATMTHWGRGTHICVSKLTIIGSDNGLSPGRRQAIIWTNAGILLIRPSETNFNEMFIEILAFSLMEMCLKVSSAKWRPFHLGLNVIMMALSSEWGEGKLQYRT